MKSLKQFLERLDSLPKKIKNFVYGDLIYEFAKKAKENFSLSDKQYWYLIYLLQDLAVRFEEPKNLKELEALLEKELSLQGSIKDKLARLVWHEIISQINLVWESIEKEEKEKISKVVFVPPKKIPPRPVLNLKQLQTKPPEQSKSVEPETIIKSKPKKETGKPTPSKLPTFVSIPPKQIKPKIEIPPVIKTTPSETSVPSFPSSLKPSKPKAPATKWASQQKEKTQLPKNKGKISIVKIKPQTPEEKTKVIDLSDL